MLRYVRLDLLQQNIIECCCSRVIFSNVKVKVPDIKLLFDNNFITENLKKYKRIGGESLDVMPAVCGKCDGLGFLDWVARLRTEEGVDEEELWHPKKPIQVKNENPIENVFVYNNLYIYYISCYDKDDLEYRCDQCGGIGMTQDIKSFKSSTVSEFLNNLNYKPTLVETIKEPPLRKLFKFLGTIIFRGGSKDDKTI